MRSRCSSTMSSAASFERPRAVLVAVLVLAVVTPVWADVCVWRDPERTMQKIFPAARDYRTVTVKMTPDKVSTIEKLLGAKLDDSEKGEFNFYDINGIVQGKPQKLGTLIALAGTGEYGVIEVVIGVDPNGRVVGSYIQRSRERVTHALENPEFLNQFKGKTKDDAFEVGSAIKPAIPDAVAASRTVAFVIKKMLLFRAVLTPA